MDRDELVAAIRQLADDVAAGKRIVLMWHDLPDDAGECLDLTMGAVSGDDAGTILKASPTTAAEIWGWVVYESNHTHPA